MGSDAAPIRPILSGAAGVLRDGDSLRTAARALHRLAVCDGAASDPAIVALMIVISALRREESRGAHARNDFPDRADCARHSRLRLDDAFETAQALIPDLVG